jgi:prepilin-type N-terminal cleavage/methylation domain-containing protein
MTLSTKHHLHEKGFTLLEVMVSVTLIAVMAVGIWELLRISLHSWTRGTGFIDASQAQRSILDSIKKQMASAYPLYSPEDVQQAGSRFPMFVGDESSLQFISLNSLQFIESPGLTFVYYEITEDSDGGYSLIERETPYTGQLPDEATIDESRALPVFQNLTECSFEYFTKGDANNNTTAEWVTEWDASTELLLPAAVAVNMVSSDSQGNLISRRIVAPIATIPIDPRTGIQTTSSSRTTSGGTGRSR